MLHGPSVSIQGYGTFGDKAGIIYRRFINPSKLYAEGGLGSGRKQEQFGEEPGRRAKPLSQLSATGNRNCDTLTKLNFPGQEFSVLKISRDWVFNSLNLLRHKNILMSFTHSVNRIDSSSL